MLRLFSDEPNHADIYNNTGETGLFKFPKTDYTGDYWAEKLAYEIGRLINIEVAKTDIGIYNGRIGSFSYNILQDGET